MVQGTNQEFERLVNATLCSVGLRSYFFRLLLDLRSRCETQD